MENNQNKTKELLGEDDDKGFIKICPHCGDKLVKDKNTGIGILDCEKCKTVWHILKIRTKK